MFTTKRMLALVCLGIGLLGSHTAAAQASPASASAQSAAPTISIPRLVKFSGIVKDDAGNPRTGTTGITFALYKDQSGSAALWLETQNVTLDAQGRYTVLLGANSAEGMTPELFSSNEAQWLGVQPEGLPEQRVLLVSVPYALKAADAETLGGIPASSFVLAAPTAAGATTSTGQTGTTPTAAGALVPSPAISGSGAANTLAKFDASTTNLISSSISDTGTAVSTTESVGIGTASPNALLDVEFTTAMPTNAMLSNITYNNTTAVTENVVSAFDMNFMDASTATNLSKQTARIALIRQPGATGGVTAFDSALTATEFLHASALFPVRGINIEGPTMDAGTTLSNFTGLYIGSPGGTGTVTSKFALVTEPNAGNVGIGTTSPTVPLEVAGNLTVDSPGVIAGNGSKLTNLPAGQLSGTVTQAALSGVNGSGLTNLTAANLTGTLPPATLPANVALVNASNAFSAPQAVTAAPGGTGAALAVAATGTTGVSGLLASTNDPAGFGALITNSVAPSASGGAYILEVLDSTGKHGLRVNANGLELNLPVAEPIPNDSTGTTLNTLVRYTNSGTVATVPTSGSFAATGVVGAVVAGAGNTGNADVAFTGITNCIFDNAASVGDYVVPSQTVTSSTPTAGDCHDYGNASGLPRYPLSGVQIVGRVLAANPTPGTPTQIYMYGYETRAIGSVNSLSLTNETAAIAATTLFTPLVSGLFRVNIYMTITGGTCTGGTINPNVTWNDENGAQSLAEIGGPNTMLSCSGGYAQGSAVIHAVPGAPIQFLTTFNSVTGSPTYEAFVTMDRLQ